MSRRGVYWLVGVPGALGALLLGLLLALPGFVSSSAHRAYVEGVASALTGRKVSIKGELTLHLLPRPEITATDIELSGPEGEDVTAAALTMDLSVGALLQGGIAADRLDLARPVITLPWPLPGGPKALLAATPITTLRARVTDGTLDLGGAVLTGLDADVHTLPGGGVNLTGAAMAGPVPVTLEVTLAAPALDGGAALDVSVKAPLAGAGFDGTLNGDGTLSGQLQATGPQQATLSATLTADGQGLTLDPLSLSQGAAALTGRVAFEFGTPAVRATLTGQNVDVSGVSLGQMPPLPPVPVSVQLALSNVRALGQMLPAVNLTLDAGPRGLVLSNVAATLAGGASLSGHVSAAPDGRLSGALGLQAPALGALLAAYGLAPETAWPGAQLSATLGGTLGAPVLSTLSGTLGADHVSGALVLNGQGAHGHLAFDHLALLPLAAWLEQRPAGGFALDGELSAARAEAGPVKLTNLILDGTVDGTLTVRQASASLYGGVAAGSLSLDAGGIVTAAHGMVLLPQAQPLANALLPAGLTPPPALLKNRFSLVFAAGGPPSALATSAVARLGAFTLTAAPVLDLGAMSAQGPLTLRNPSADAALGLFGVSQGVLFPGPGSLGLRARFTLAHDQYGLNDFQLALGQLNASGQVMVNKGRLSGQIDADTLALPVLTKGMTLPASLPLPANVSGTVGLRANRVAYGFAELAGPVAGHFTLTASQALGFTLDPLAYAGGTLAGTASVTFAPTALPHFAATLSAKGLDAGALKLGLAFPYPLTQGRFDANAQLAADGFDAKSWLATLAGTASLNAQKGQIGGFALAELADVLQAGHATAMRIYGAATHGATWFDQLSLAATLKQGNCTLTSAALSGPAGTATASGGIDLFDRAVALKLTLAPALTPPVTVGMAAIGPWAATRHLGHLHDALAWPGGK
ncbi:AsmA-like C-terminal region-containing protein [Acidocella sp.]|uniref:AsmA-like C-terminal region-containing protein n=1 Tax=Acidocella sp. TaxID=50710 RepID=UPI0026146EC0|nr:AsmA-like C-terminal region-containing protein [Acidocella sp.]